MNSEYRARKSDREKMHLPPLPLTAQEVRHIGDWLAEGRSTPPDGEENLVALLADRTPVGVDPAAEVKSAILADVIAGNIRAPGLSPEKAVELLGFMQGGYNIRPLLECLERPDLAPAAVQALAGCILAGDAVETAARMFRGGNVFAGDVLAAWANASWFLRAPALPECFRFTVYKVDGEVNTDDLSPARQAVNRPDIPLHASFLGVSRFPGGREAMERLRREAGPDGDWRPVFVADTLGTGSSRKSAVNSLIWLLGDDIPHVPNKRRGGVVIAQRLAPIFQGNFGDSGGLAVAADVSALATGQRVTLETGVQQGEGKLLDEKGGELARFVITPAQADAWRAGGRINLIIGRKLSARAAAILERKPAEVFAPVAEPPAASGRGYTLAQKLVGQACGKDGVRPGEYCEPAMSTVGSQDTTGPMTRDELSALACLKFSADLVMQSFCHTAAYPTDQDRNMQQSLPDFFRHRGGVALAPGDGIIHSWLNRLLLPDRVGTGGDSHTRFPLGISFPAGSGLVALAAAQGFMPLDMPESALVTFSGRLPEGITLRDVVNAIPLFAMRAGLLDRPGEGTKNAFNGRILEMEGIPGLTAEEAFELTCATAERSAAAATITLEKERVEAYLKANVDLIGSLLAAGYRDDGTLANRKTEMEAWLARPEIVRRDPDAEFAARLAIDLGDIREPIVARPNNPDLAVWLSEAAGEKIDEVFIGSCMSNIGHFRAAARIFAGATSGLGVKRLWLTPPTRMDRDQLQREGALTVFAKIGARLEIPGCSLCMGNQARVADEAIVFSTSTRNFDNRLGTGARVFLGSAVLAAVVALLGRIPTKEEYFGVYREAVLPHMAEMARPLECFR